MPSGVEETSCNCRVCGSSHLTVRFKVNGYTLQTCRECTFVQVAQKPTAEILDKVYGTQYFTHSKYKDGRTLALEVQRRLEILRRFVKPNARILDAGCATGDFVAAASAEYSAFGIDRSEFAITTAVRKYPSLEGRVWSGFLEDMKPSETAYDAICLWDVIEHVWDPISTLRTIFDHLSPTGVIILSTPSIDAPIARLLKKYWAFMTPPEHLGFFTGKSFERTFCDLVPAKILDRQTHGKWANVGFVFYKANRVMPRLVPSVLVNAIANTKLSRQSVYIPTNDIQYVVARKS